MLAVPTWLQSVWHRTTTLLLPPICAGCAQDLPQHAGQLPLCHNCCELFAIPQGTLCPRCAAPAPATSIRSTGCIYCEDTAFRFHALVALGVYERGLQACVLKMKQPSYEALTLAAGRLLAARIRESEGRAYDVVTAIPMHWSRRWWRGVNAAAILAEAVAHELQLPLRLDLVQLVKHVPRQSSLTPSRRRRNMREAFRTSSRYRLQDARVLVVDDVLTTGGTMNACAQALRSCGASQVTGAVIARGIGANG